MALYAYRGLGADGKHRKGTVNADSRQEALQLLRAKAVYPLDVKPSEPPQLNSLPLIRRPIRRGSSPRQLATFTRQFATLLRATIPYDTVLGMLTQQTSDMGIKAVLAEVRGRVLEGARLADAFAQHPRYFPHMVISMVRSGESSGTMELVMTRLADYYENLARLRSRMTSALVYPAFMMLFGTAVVIFMVTFIIPRITQLLDNFGAELPLSTQMLIGLSDVLIDYWWLLLLLAAGGGLWAQRMLQTETGKLFRDRVNLRLPLWRTLQRKMVLQRFAQTLATLLHSGVELKSALVIAMEVMENRVYLAAMKDVIEDVQSRGLPLAVALQRTNLVPEDVCQMVAIGEKTAALDGMLENVSRRLGDEISTTLEGTMAMFEPIMILVMGSIVGFIVISVLLPLLQMNQLLG